MIDAVSSVMHSRLCCTCAAYPSVLLPQGCNVVVVPGLLLAQYTGQTMGSVNSLWVAVMVSENWKDWTGWQEVLELFIDAHFGVLSVRSGQL